MAWVTAMRHRLILPLGRIFRVAQKNAGVSGEECPKCGCPHCLGRDQPARVDAYGMHMSSAAAYYTRRHHLLASLFERFAQQAGLLAHHHPLSFEASISLSADDKRKQVDTKLDGLSYDDVEHILPGAARHALRDRAEARLAPADLHAVQLDLLLDYTFHHPGAYLSKVQELRSRLPDLADAMAEVAVRTKEDKYRECATVCSGERPYRPAMAFTAAVLSVCGRQHPTTWRMMRFIARRRATRAVCASDGADWRHPDLGAEPNPQALARQIGWKTHLAMMAFSSLAAAALVDGMEECARAATRRAQSGQRASGGGSPTFVDSVPGLTVPSH
jgi:hypothetical protein